MKNFFFFFFFLAKVALTLAVLGEKVAPVHVVMTQELLTFYFASLKTIKQSADNGSLLACRLMIPIVPHSPSSIIKHLPLKVFNK